MTYQVEKDKMQGISETMLQTLYARAQESKKDDRHIYDEKAIERSCRNWTMIFPRRRTIR